MFGNVPGPLPFVKDGKLRALGITSLKRLPLVREIPTLDEAGVPGYEVVGWNGLFAPRNTPKEILARLNADLVKVLARADVAEHMAKLGAEPGGDSQQHAAAFVAGEAQRWGKIIRDKGIKPE
jgi:tripartite-type tricarboxylate transporter receptor subunit TctC